MARSEGHRLLREQVERLGRGAQAEIARKVGRSEPTVTLWLRGSMPAGDVIGLLERECGIPALAWGRSGKRRK